MSILGRVLTFALAGVLIVSADAHGFSGDALQALVAGLPGELHQLSSTGRWRTADMTGFYRVIVLRGGYEHIAEHLYVQWMRDGDSEKPPRVVATASVVEINDTGPFTLSHSLRAVATNQLSITVNAQHGYTNRRRRFVVLAATPGLYTVRARESQ